MIRAAEGPVIDTACAALLLLAQEVHARGYKVALTGEGADEWLAGYPWYKVHQLLGFLDVIPGLPLSQLAAPGLPAPEPGARGSLVDCAGASRRRSAAPTPGWTSTAS